MKAPENWLPVPDFPGYEVSDLGRVRSYRAPGAAALRCTPHALKPCDDGHGYLRVYLMRDSRRRSMKVSWLVLTAFVGPRPSGLDACHNDGNRHNDARSNLRWDTRKGNLADTLAHGTRTRGARNGSATLTEQKVRLIRARIAARVSQSRIAAEFGIAQPTVSDINSGRRWGWLE